MIRKKLGFGGKTPAMPKTYTQVLAMIADAKKQGFTNGLLIGGTATIFGMLICSMVYHYQIKQPYPAVIAKTAAPICKVEMQWGRDEPAHVYSGTIKRASLAQLP